MRHATFLPTVTSPGFLLCCLSPTRRPSLLGVTASALGPAGSNASRGKTHGLHFPWEKKKERKKKKKSNPWTRLKWQWLLFNLLVCSSLGCLDQSHQCSPAPRMVRGEEEGFLGLELSRGSEPPHQGEREPSRVTAVAVRARAQVSSGRKFGTGAGLSPAIPSPRPVLYARNSEKGCPVPRRPVLVAFAASSPPSHWANYPNDIKTQSRVLQKPPWVAARGSWALREGQGKALSLHSCCFG